MDGGDFMKIGIGIPNAIPNTDGSVFVEWAQAAESKGFSSLSTIGRIVFDCHEELIALTACAAVTKKIRLATTVMIGPAREDTLLAKQAATLHNISGGRLSLGLGIGWRKSDFDVTDRGDLWSRRGDAVAEQVDRLRQVWKGDDIGPDALGGPEIMLGGAADPALERAGRICDAFIAGPFPKEQVAEHFTKVDAAAGAKKPRRVTSRYFALGDVEEEMLANVRAYYEAGGEDFVKMMQSGVLRTPEQVKQAVEDMKSVGADEICFWPQVNHLDQVEKLAQIVF